MSLKFPIPKKKSESPLLYIYNSYGQLINRVYGQKQVNNYYTLVEESLFVNQQIVEQLEFLGLVEIPKEFKDSIQEISEKGYKVGKNTLEQYFESPFSDIFLNNDYNSTLSCLKPAIENLHNGKNVITTPYAVSLLFDYASKKQIFFSDIDSKINLSTLPKIYVDTKYKDQMPISIIYLLKIFINLSGNTLTTDNINQINTLMENLETINSADLENIESLFCDIFYDKDLLEAVSQIVKEKFFEIKKIQEIPQTNIYFKIIESLNKFSKAIQKKNQYYLVDDNIVISPEEIKEIEEQRMTAALKYVLQKNESKLTTSTKFIENKKMQKTMEEIVSSESFTLNQNQLKIALLIDCDNASHNAIEGVINELSKYGVVNVRKAYGNWTDPKLTGWQDKLHKFSLIPVQQFDYTKGKNATDIAMSIDAMEMLYTNDLKAFAFMTSDSDFTPLIMKLLSNGMTVFGFGEQKTPLPFVQACSRFIYTENLTKGEIVDNTPRKKVDINNDSELIELLDTAIEQTANENGWANVAAVGLYLNNKSSFSPLNYGYSKLGQLFRALDKYEVYMDNLTMYVSK